MYFNVEVEAIAAQNVRAEQTQFAALIQHGIERFKQVAIFSAQINETFAGTNDVGGNGHALKNQIGLARQQHAVLEGAGLAFVSVADDIACASWCVMTGFPFQAGGEPGTAATAQGGLLDFVQSRRGPDVARLHGLMP